MSDLIKNTDSIVQQIVAQFTNEHPDDVDKNSSDFKEVKEIFKEEVLTVYKDELETLEAEIEELQEQIKEIGPQNLAEESIWEEYRQKLKAYRGYKLPDVIFLF